MKDMIKRIREEREGFTLAELLIVVAIIAVLVAIAIPVFSAQLEKSREATDAANLRAAYAEVMAAAITESNDGNSKVTITEENGTVKTVTMDVTDVAQKTAGWQNTEITEIGGVEIANVSATALKGWTVTYTASDHSVTFAEKN